MAQINVAPTVEVALRMATHLEYIASQVRSLAKEMEEKGDITIASEITQIVAGSLLPNLRLDLLVSRPIREFQHTHRNA